jgi:MFS family permease
MKQNSTSNWRIFQVLWAGQALSLLGTSMTRFALLIWAFEREQSVTSLALLGFFSTLTFILASPLAGVLVDRWDRRKVMLISDILSGLMTTALFFLNNRGELQVWHLYLANGFTGAFSAFQEPAFWATISLIVPDRHFARANGMVGLAKSAVTMLSPAFAGLLLQSAGLNWVMAADLFTLCLALASLLLIRLPSPPPSQEGQQARGTCLQEMRFGARYISRQRGLLEILVVFFFINLFGTITYFTVHTPLILIRSGGDQVGLGIVRMVMGVGGIFGGLLISIWGVPRHKTRVFLLSTGFSFLLCDFLTAVSRSVPAWAIAGFIAELTIPFIVSPYYAIWQEVVPPDVQGRVFATREMLQVSSQPLGYLLGGLLADRIFEPALQGGTLISAWLSPLVGSGPGAGMAAMFICTAILGALTGFIGLVSPAIRRLDEDPQPAVVMA